MGFGYWLIHYKRLKKEEIKLLAVLNLASRVNKDPITNMWKLDHRISLLFGLICSPEQEVNSNLELGFGGHSKRWF